MNEDLRAHDHVQTITIREVNGFLKTIASLEHDNVELREQLERKTSALLALSSAHEELRRELGFRN